MATPHPFPLHDETTAPPAASAALAATRKNFGMIPNLERVMASAPPLLEAYSRTWDLFDTTTLSEIERQVVYLTANFENDCAYCVPWHTLLATKAGMAPEAIEALRNGSRIPDEKLEALRSFTRVLIANRGKAVAADLESFFAAGYTPVQVLEVILGLAVKLMSNYTNSIAATPLDPEPRPYLWKKPTIAPRDE
jgi:AhpD family alkylhydroperoxidase